MPPLPENISRVGDLPESFVQLLSQRPHMPGDVIAARYELEQLLGDGAMGQVFAAVNLAIRRRVAIKVLKPDVLADAQFRHRFQQEAEAIARIEHRNVAGFIDLVVGDPTFLVMEYVPGPTLSSVLRKEGKLEPRRAIAIAVRLCWALEAAHRSGVIHRDVKPSNVILAPDPEHAEEPKLIDFGLAKLQTTALDAPTRTGQVVGTPHYMAPEQIANKQIDARVDVYALGCVLYHMLSGRPPFEGESDVQLMYQHMQTLPKPIDVKDVPSGLQSVLNRALAKEPDGRYPSMRELASALTSLERRRHPEARREDTDVVRRRERVRLIFGVGVLATALAAGAGWLLGRSKTTGAETMLVVDTVPAAARLVVDGKAQAQPTPVALSRLAPGKHALRIELAGHQPLERTIELSPGARQVITLQLPPASHVLHVESIPGAASTFLDGRFQGLTPLALEIADDDFHELRLEKTGYEPLRHRLPPEARDPSLSLTLQAQTRPVARLVVGADAALPVFIDGQDTGFVAPTIELEVLAGAHLVELRDSDGKVVADAHITVARGETRRLELQRARAADEGEK